MRGRRRRRDLAGEKWGRDDERVDQRVERELEETEDGWRERRQTRRRRWRRRRKRQIILRGMGRWRPGNQPADDQDVPAGGQSST